MKVLYFTTSEEDYLQDTVLYGLRKLLGADAVDYPKKEILYRSCRVPSMELYGRGFTAWKLLEDIEIDRTEIDSKIWNREFDVIVFGSIQRQRSIAYNYLKKGHFFLPGYRFAFIDGEDNRRINWTMLPFGPYYKRERVGLTCMLTRRINFGIPASKVRRQCLEKTRLFAQHVQCDEAYKIDWISRNCSKRYAFVDESAYYENLASSRFAVTMKKSGWDCMRHYEIAANSTVMAFYNLHLKPRCSAPHGLTDMQNVVTFSTADELVAKIEYIDKHNLYANLQNETAKWVSRNTCEHVATSLLRDLATSPTWRPRPW